MKEISDDDLHIRLISKPENFQRPLVILIPGSGGSFIKNEVVFGLVQDGYDVLSIAYQGLRGLPKELELVPLEYLEQVVIWSKDQFPQRKIVLLGISKGAEYSLAFASNFDLVDGLICYSPSSFVIPNHVTKKKDEEQVSSWSLNGKPLPFVTLKPFDDPAGMVEYHKYFDTIFRDTTLLLRARIPVENIHCDMLLLSGSDDRVWPSTKMSDYMIRQLQNKGVGIQYKHLSYQDCGHQFVWFEDSAPTIKPEYQSMNLTGIKRHKFLFGGSREGTLDAMVQSRNEVLHFLTDVD